MPSENEELNFRPQQVERAKGVENHPTVSQDWTNKETNDHKRLVALREERLVAHQKKKSYPAPYVTKVICCLKPASPPSKEAQEAMGKYMQDVAKEIFGTTSDHDQRLGVQADEKPYVCTSCGDSFWRMNKLQDHKVREHSHGAPGSSLDIQRTPSPMDDEKPSLSSMKPPEEPSFGEGSLGDWRSKKTMTKRKDPNKIPDQTDVLRNKSSTNVDECQRHKRRRKNHDSSSSQSESAGPSDEKIERRSNRKGNLPAGQRSVEAQALLRQLEVLKKEKASLESQLQGPPQRCQTIYLIHRALNKSPIMYLDQPQWLAGDKDMASLQGQLPITRLDSYLDRHPEVVFVVLRDIAAQNSDIRADDGNPTTQWTESIIISSSRLTNTIKRIVDELSQSLSIGESFTFKGSEVTLAAPYLAFYHYRELLVKLASSLNEESSSEWNILLQYIDNNFGDQYMHVRKHLRAGTIHRGLLHYLVKEGDVLISQKNHDRSAYVAKSKISRVPHPNLEPQDASPSEDARQSRPKAIQRNQQTGAGGHDENSKSSHREQINSKDDAWQLEVEFWEFDGNFQKAHKTIQLRVPTGSSEILSVRDLELFPIEFAKAELVARLKAVGSQLWKSRIRRYVSYRATVHGGETDSTELRYMIDPATYAKLHKNTSKFSLTDDLGTDLMNGEEAPPDPFLLLLPNTIDGFNMQNKRWEKLEVSRISDVSWNKDAFESLVIDPFAKKLIKALVMEQLEREKGTDLIAGKGQGLLALLHGGPGTGKTFTAETVAEIAERPLYRVTCGDLGAEPTKIEDYLESVLYLGKMWNCVVLLDEADVYLEERRIESLTRNALVSVFLRVLEYYQGILILTSNRVGTFDESFKSRIQLALPYPRLRFEDRCTIWENFFRRLETFLDVGVDFDDVYRHLKDLARNELNGRQIRNAITTARQLARYEGKDLKFADLQQVIKVALNFDKCTIELQGGATDDERQREDGIRP